MKMESEAETEPTSLLQLQLLSLPPLKSPEPPWTFASPLHTAASVPFRWEEEPGKPRPCTALSLPANNGVKCLELPPRLLKSESRMTKTPSPTTVLEGPYVGRSIFHSSSSLRFLRRRNYQEDSLDCGSGGSSPERGLLGTMVISERVMSRDRGLFGSLRRRTFSFRGKREVVSMGRFVFPDKDCGEGSGSERREAVKVTRMGRKRSLLGLSQARSHFWVTGLSSCTFPLYFVLGASGIGHSNILISSNLARPMWIRTIHFATEPVSSGTREAEMLVTVRSYASSLKGIFGNLHLIFQTCGPINT